MSADIFEQLLERAAILQWDAGLSHDDAEAEAERLLFGDQMEADEQQWLAAPWH